MKKRPRKNRTVLEARRRSVKRRSAARLSGTVRSARRRLAARLSGTVRAARGILKIEADAIRRLIPRIGKNFESALQLLYQCSGRVIVTGMGKTGFIGRKISATLASTGTPSLYLHPAEAFHGDLGMVTGKDLVMVFSHSGETEEIIRLLSPFKKLGVQMMALTGNPRSTLARNADVALDISIDREARSEERRVGKEC